jgi:hypothetical protein
MKTDNRLSHKIDQKHRKVDLSDVKCHCHSEKSCHVS